MSVDANSAFDSGNIIVRSSSPGEIRLAIRPDVASDFVQWFHFRLDGVRERGCRVIIENASETTYPSGWKDYAVATSADRRLWYRTPCEYDGRTLSWSIERDVLPLWFAYFAPYSLERHAEQLGRCAVAPGASVERLCLTADGRALDAVHLGPPVAGTDVPETDGWTATAGQAVGAGGGRRQVWVIARQHPGESMASWWIEGWLERLLDGNDATSRALRAMADIHVVPNMNPDGTFRGNLRTNARGANLNREWADPSPERSPEVFHVLRRMHETGVDLALDIHGDEALPYNFIAGTEGVPSWNAERDAELVAFKHTLASLNPDFQTVHGYPRTPPGKANLSYASNHVAETFGCLAMTLEMPFKDTADTPRPDVGWSPERSAKLGRSFVDAVYLTLCGRLIHPAP